MPGCAFCHHARPASPDDRRGPRRRLTSLLRWTGSTRARRLSAAEGGVSPGSNPNGSARSIAGITSGDRRILGLMPHPEDYVDPLMGGEDGAPMFAGLVEALAA